MLDWFRERVGPLGETESSGSRFVPDFYLRLERFCEDCPEYDWRFAILSSILGRKRIDPPKRRLDRPLGPSTTAILLRTPRKLAVPTMFADALSASSLTFFEYLTARNAVPKTTNGSAMKGKITP